MNALTCRMPLVAGALVLLASCYSNNGGFIDLDAGVGSLSPVGPGPDGGNRGDGGFPIGPGPGPDGGMGGSGGGAGGGAGSGGSGGFGGDPLTGEWQAPVIIEAHDGTALNPHVSINRNGRATAVWVQSFLGEYKVWANRYGPLSGWEGDLLIGTTDGSVADLSKTSQPHVVVDSSGLATAAWGNYGDPIVRGLVSRRYAAPDGWGAPETIYAGVSTAGDPRLAVDPSGKVMAVFATGTGAWANQFQFPAGWGDAEIIDNERNAPIGAQVALGPDGDGWAAWTQAPTGIQYNIFGNTFTSGGWDDAGKVEDGSLGSSFDPQLAIDDDGNLLFIWRKASGLQSQVWSNGWDASAGEFTDPERLDASGNGTAPAIASDPQGNGTAVWIQVPIGGSPVEVVASRYTPDDGWGAVETLAMGDIRFQPRVAMDSQGNAVIVYVQKVEYEDLSDAWAHTYSAGAWSPAVRLGIDDRTGAAFQPSVAMDSRGNAVVVWREDGDMWAATFK
jgi:hypothetical protein